jgi:hypothetical protein
MEIGLCRPAVKIPGETRFTPPMTARYSVMKKLILSFIASFLLTLTPSGAAINRTINTAAPSYDAGDMSIDVSYPHHNYDYYIQITNGSDIDITIELREGTTYQSVDDNSSHVGHDVYVGPAHDFAWISISGLPSGSYTISGSYWGSTSTSMDSHLNVNVY